MSHAYQQFLENKAQRGADAGFDPLWIPDFLFDFQKSLVEWAVRKGRGAIFADCGLGKTPMQLVWAENVVRKTGGNVLILTPLAVSDQTVAEAEKFGIEAKRSKDGAIHSGITVTNYERLHHFDPDRFSGVVCDESSAIKHFDGKRRKEVTWFMRKTPYRLLATATAAPNDYIELGTSSEALGIMGQRDVISTFFRSTDDMHHVLYKNGDFWNTHKFTFKAHAEESFWRWVCSWARAMRKPSDFGFEDGPFLLPPLEVVQHVVDHFEPPPGELFPRVAVTLREQREERRQTLEKRCRKVAELVEHDAHAVAWCHMNDEGKLLSQMIPDAKEIAGSTPDDEKEELLKAFGAGQLRVLVTKPKIGAFGLNWQHCSHMTFFPSHSFEQWYQGVRRCWRFGQKNPVRVDIVTTEGEAGVTANLQKKAGQCDKLFEQLVALMNNAMRLDRSQNFSAKEQVPSWL